MSGKLYASLTGPLLGFYFPLPKEVCVNENAARVAMNTSKLKSLWCSVYTEAEVDRSIRDFGGTKLSDRCARNLDYDAYEVQKWLPGAAGGRHEG